MKIGVIADTHGHAERTRTAIEALRAKGAEVFFHCGDLTTPEVAKAFAGVRAYLVFGNNDADRKAIARAIASVDGVLLGNAGEITIDGKRLAVTHGHLKAEVKRLLTSAPDYLFLGHSHRKKSEKAGRTRVINPGALHRATPWTCALVDLATDRVHFLVVMAGTRTKSRP